MNFYCSFYIRVNYSENIAENARRVLIYDNELHNVGKITLAGEQFLCDATEICQWARFITRYKDSVLCDVVSFMLYLQLFLSPNSYPWKQSS